MTQVRVRTVRRLVPEAVCLLLLTVLQSRTLAKRTHADGAGSSQKEAHKSWSDYGGGPDSSHYLDFVQIDKANVDLMMPVSNLYLQKEDRGNKFQSDI